MINTEKYSGKNIYLKPADLKAWMNARIYRHTAEALSYDPYTPYQTEKQEIEFYERQIKTKYFLLYGIYKITDDEHLGFLYAFEYKKLGSLQTEPFAFSDEGGYCETGIGIFKSENFNKGYGSQSYDVFLRFLLKEYNILRTVIFTHPSNQRAQRLYKKLNYKNLGKIMLGGLEFVKMEIELNQN